MDKLTKCFLRSSAAVLATSGTLKVISIAASDRVSDALDPVVGLPSQTLLLLVALLELVVATFILSTQRPRLGCQLVACLATCFVVYRGALLLLAPDRQCGCLGTVFDSVPILREAKGVLSLLFLIYLFAGSHLLLARHTRQRGDRSDRLDGARVGLAVGCLLFLAGLPAQRLMADEAGVTNQFIVQGTLEAWAPGAELLREVGFQVVVSNCNWRIRLLARDRSAVFKEVDIGGDGEEIYSVSRDWNGGRLAHAGASKFPYPGAIEEHAVLWAVYVLPCTCLSGGLSSIENPFSTQIPRPLVNVELHAPTQEGLLFELCPVDETETRHSDPVGGPNPASRCVVYEWIEDGKAAGLPRLFELEWELDQPPEGRVAVRRFMGSVTNIIHEPWRQPMLPPMPQGETLTFVDTRYGNLANPLAIGAFHAQGVWPSRTDLEAYPEYRRWAGRPRFSPGRRWMEETILFFVVVLTVTMSWWLRTNKTTTTP